MKERELVQQRQKSSSAKRLVDRRFLVKQLGLDLGTKHIVLAWRDNKNLVKYRYEINGYLKFDRVDSFLEQLLIKQQVPFVRRGNELIAIGSKAEQIAFNFNKTLCRPMAEGALSRDDEDAQEIISIIIKSIIGQLADDTILYYCTTAKALNSEKHNVEFHKKIIKLMIDSYIADNQSIRSYHVNEARCLIMEENGPAIGISWGAGTITVHAGIFGVPIFEFAILGAGDWIDIEVAKRFGYDPDHPGRDSRETPTTVCRKKEKLDLLQEPEGKLEQAIKLMYEILIENVVSQIVKGFNENRDKYRFDNPIPIINAGGTCMPTGFIELLTKKINDVKKDMCVPIGDIRKAQEPLFAVSRGCLLAAELHKDN